MLARVAGSGCLSLRGGTRNHAGLLVLIGLLLSISYGRAEPVSPEYRKLVTDGYNELQAAEDERVTGQKTRKAGEFEAALPCYDRAIRRCQKAVDMFRAAQKLPDDVREALFYEAVAWNRMGQAIDDYNRASLTSRFGGGCAYCESFRAIERSRQLGMNSQLNSNFDLEVAEALVGVGEFDRALATLNNYHPEEHYAADRANQLRTIAKAALEEASKTKIAEVCGKPAHPDKVRTTGDTAAAPAKTSSWELADGFTTSVGYNGNVASLGRGQPLLPGLHQKSAFFNESILSLEADYYDHHQVDASDLIDKMALSYGVIHDAYANDFHFDSLAQTATLSYCRALPTQSCLNGQLADAWLRTDTKNVSNTMAGQIGFKHWQIPEQKGECPPGIWATQATYNLSWAYYSAQPKRDFNADGFNQRWAIEESWKSAPSTAQWFAGYGATAQFGHEWNLCQGKAAGRQRENPLIKGECVLYKPKNNCGFVQEVRLAASYEYRHDEYHSAPTPTRQTPNPIRRIDDTHLGDFVLSAKMWYDEKLQNRLEGILEFQTKTNDSNLPAKTYDQPRVLASIKINF